MSRPRVLDEVSKREICALVTAGMSLNKVADYVGCDRKTIYHERRHDQEFDLRMRRAGMACHLNPLEAMRRAAATHWRAAAWLIERQDRQEAQRRASKAQLSRDELLELGDQVKEIIARATLDPFATPQLQQTIENLFITAVASPTRRRPGPSRQGPTTQESIRFFNERSANRDPQDHSFSPTGTGRGEKLTRPNSTENDQTL